MSYEKLGAVSETLFLPLYSLARESKEPDPIIRDPGAVALTEELNLAFRTSRRRFFRRLASGRLPRSMVVALALRIRRIDGYVREFLRREPEGVVVNLGCGLDDRRRRVDNGTVRWYDLDLPEVIALRRQLLGETDRFVLLPSSVTDRDWMKALPAEPGERFLFVAEGLLMYLADEDAAGLLRELNRRFPGGELIAELVARRVVKMMKGRLGRGKLKRELGLSGNVVYSFGVNGGGELEGRVPGMKLLDEWSFFDDGEAKLGWMGRLGRWDYFRRMQWVARYRLGAAEGTEARSDDKT